MNRCSTSATHVALGLLGLLALAVPALADTVPDVVGLPFDAARPMLERAGFPPSLSYDPSRPEGIVFSQDPGGLADRPKGTGIGIRVGGKAPEVVAPPAGPIPPPQVFPPTEGTPPSPGPQGAPPTGTGPVNEWPLPPPTMAPPTAGSGGNSGDTNLPITDLGPPLDALTASATPEMPPNRTGPPLPNTIRRLETEARSALAGWNLNVETTLAMPEFVGRVVNQAPTPGEPLAPGETVTIVVGLASLPTMDHHVVPPTEGLPVAEAKARIEREGFRAVLRSLPSVPEMSGRVISQNPLPVSLGLKGSDVVVRVGRGAHSGTMRPGPIRIPPTVPALSPPGAPSDLGAPPAGAPDTLETPPQPVPGVPYPSPGTPVPMPGPGPVPGPGPTAPPSPFPTPPPETPIPPGTPKPGTPQPIGPAEGSTFPRAYGATFQWTSVAGASRYEWEIQEEQTGSAWKTLSTLVVKETRHRPQRLERGRFRWRVRALGERAPGDWSGFFRLYVY